MDAYIEALLLEIQYRKESFTDTPFSTLYIGGGSPSLLSIEQLQTIVNQLYNSFSFDKNIEFTIELNPEQVTREYLVGLKQVGVNRVSFGVQSFQNHILKYLGRIQTAEQAVDAIKCAHEIGFEHISIDLIYAIQERRDTDWQHDLDTAFSLPIEHLSAYSLTIEENCKLYKQLKNKELNNPDENISLQDYSELQQAVHRHGFLQYEISNYCKNRAFSQHNSNYWTLQPYIGLGASAHSYNGKERQWNIADNAAYIYAMQNKKCCWEKEELDISTRYNEYIMLGLRTIKGVDMQYIKAQFGSKYLTHFEKSLTKVLPLFYTKKGSIVKLSPGGFLIADNIITKLFDDQ
jgi:oxygen-independent coproporphyrinogen-3 oxidase